MIEPAVVFQAQIASKPEQGKRPVAPAHLPSV
jgi:hypothetical protein